MENDDLLSNESFHLTGNEDDCSYIYKIRMCDLGTKFEFWKTLTINVPYEFDTYGNKLDINSSDQYDWYEETFFFTTYCFQVGKKIPKINNGNITANYVKDFKCDINYETYAKIWNHVKKNTDMFRNEYAVHLIEPNEILKKYSPQLYEKYVQYYNQIVNASRDRGHIWLKKQV